MGIHKLHLTGNVYDLNDVADFPGVYFAAQAGAIWLKNSKGVSLRLKSDYSQGIALLYYCGWVLLLVGIIIGGYYCGSVVPARIAARTTLPQDWFGFAPVTTLLQG